MIIAGAGGAASQLFDDLVASKMQDVVFWSEIETKYRFIKEKFKIIKTDQEVKDHFENISRSFIVCLGDVSKRELVINRFKNMGGRIISFISPFASISPYDTSIGNGTIILESAVIEPGVHIGEECLLNKFSKFGHGCKVENNCEIAPACIISAESQIGEGTFVGMGSIVLPGVKIGKKVTIAAGTIVRKSVPDGAMVAGNPMSIYKSFRKK